MKELPLLERKEFSLFSKSGQYNGEQREFLFMEDVIECLKKFKRRIELNILVENKIPTEAFYRLFKECIGELP